MLISFMLPTGSRTGETVIANPAKFPSVEIGGIFTFSLTGDVQSDSTSELAI